MNTEWKGRGSVVKERFIELIPFLQVEETDTNIFQRNKNVNRFLLVQE